MIQYVKGDIFDSPAKVLVNPVNTVGVMGKGLALQFKNRYPEMFKKYKEQCVLGNFFVGELMLVHEQDHDILLFPTKKDWRDPSELSYIKAGLQKLYLTYKQHNYESIAFPRIGCGCGGLNWNDVKPLMEKYLNTIPIFVMIYE